MMIRNLFIGAISLYRLLLSPVLPHSCRFYPTCSEYSIEALKRYGVIRGILLTIKRILRCNAFHPGGYDPVR